MAKSPIDAIMDSTTLSDTQKKDQLYQKVLGYINYIVNIRSIMMTEDAKLNELMDANKDSSDEHHAKTMVFYGRKLAIRDLCLGVTSTSKSYTELPNVGVFTGLDQTIRTSDYGRVTLYFNCHTGMDAIWKTGGKPGQPDLTVKHMLGSKVTMPTIRNMNTNGEGTGTNTYKVKSGYAVYGWKFATTQYMYSDDGNDYVYKIVNGSKSRVVDKRIFEFGGDSYILPYNNTILPSMPIRFVLHYVAAWYEIEFVVRHGSPRQSAPCNNNIKTRLGNTITLPLTTLIDMDAGYKIDTSTCPYGTWQTKDPNTGTVPPDPDGDPLPDMEFDADSSKVVGTDIDAGIRRLFLKITTI